MIMRHACLCIFCYCHVGCPSSILLKSEQLLESSSLMPKSMTGTKQHLLLRELIVLISLAGTIDNLASANVSL
jgi:hypothetical protein